MAFRAEPSAGTAAPHACPQCPNKVFARLCDLNKHAKSHSRPYKCKEPGCKYGTLGWPTAKELERHHNDKHSASPRTFPCLFQPCTYWSKRESNCKQHMEKAHNWVYVRSKSKGKQPTDWDFARKELEEPRAAEHKPLVTSPLQTLVVPPPGLDFILFDDDQADAIGEDDDSFESAESYLPWTSPTTRLRKNEQFIEMFSQTYDAHLDKGVQMTPRSIQGDHAQVVDDVAIKLESPVTLVDISFPTKRKYEPIDRPESRPGRSVVAAYEKQASHSSSAKARQVAPPRAQHRASTRHQDDHSDDGCRPKKKSKLDPAEDFTDTSMPDIFRHAHPSIYDRDRTERYAACHTVHREISTLVRHLGRPAHRLNVTERAIHSFDVEDADFRHPRAGVCRCCWRTFDDQQIFEDHLSSSCDKVSKGKREKWRVLYESFTPLLDPPETAVTESGPAEQEAPLETLQGRPDTSPTPDDNNVRHQTGTPPTSVPSPTLLPSATFVPLNPLGERLVSAQEHLRLQEEHRALHERHRQLEWAMQALLAQQLAPEKTKHSEPASSDAMSSATSSSKRSQRARSPGGSDQDSLVLHMDSQSTDVDVYRFMDEMEVEATRQSLTRMNSGLSTASRSTIHRVPPSPPPRRAELPAHDDSGAASQPAKHTALAHRPPLPSIPDSGYGTDERRGSLGDLPSGVPQAAVSPCPPAGAEKPQFAAPPGQGVVWGDNPFHKPPSGNTPSPQNSQHASFSTDHYDDATFGMFYQDNHSHSHSRGSPPYFPFDYSMSQE